MFVKATSANVKVPVQISGYLFDWVFGRLLTKVLGVHQRGSETRLELDIQELPTRQPILWNRNFRRHFYRQDRQVLWNHQNTGQRGGLRGSHKVREQLCAIGLSSEIFENEKTYIRAWCRQRDHRNVKEDIKD